MTTNIFYPTTNLFPQHPQILHQLVLQLFLLADRYEQEFPKDNVSHAILMPYGSYFDTGIVQAAGYRFLLGHHKPKRVVLISFAELDDEVTYLGCTYEALHTFFGDLKVDHELYLNINAYMNNQLFIKHATPFICQLPFLRSYHKIDGITPIIINTKKADFNREDFRSAIYDDSGESCYILCTNLIDEKVVYATHGYEAISGELFLSFEPDQKIS